MVKGREAMNIVCPPPARAEPIKTDTGESFCLPGFAPGRLLEIMRAAVAKSGLDLSGMTILTEAATGAYCVTPIIAALANASRVHAVTRPSRYGTVAEVERCTYELASLAGVKDRIEIITRIEDDVLARADIVTNSGHLRPIDRSIISKLPRHCVIALMFEAWEFRASDIDLPACRERAIPIVGVNERHPSVDVFSYLGPLCVTRPGSRFMAAASRCCATMISALSSRADWLDSGRMFTRFPMWPRSNPAIGTPSFLPCGRGPARASARRAPRTSRGWRRRRLSVSFGATPIARRSRRWDWASGRRKHRRQDIWVFSSPPLGRSRSCVSRRAACGPLNGFAAARRSRLAVRKFFKDPDGAAADWQRERVS
jgi:hypothetical protein